MVTKPLMSLPPLFWLSMGAMGRARVGEEQHLDRNGSNRTRLRVADAFDERLDQGDHLLVQRLQLVNGHVEQEFAGAGRLLPLRRGVASEREAFLEAVEVERVQHARQRGRREAGLRVVADVREAQTGVHEAPRTLASWNARDLFDEPVLGQLAKVKGAGRRTLADVLASLGGGERP